MTTVPSLVLGSLKNLGFTGPEPMRASDRPRTLYAGTGMLNELVGVAVGASLAFARVSGGMGASPGHVFRTYISDARRTAAENPVAAAPRPGVYGAMSERRSIDPAVWSGDLEWFRETRLSPAVQVGDLLFVSGCTGATAAEDGARAQMRRAYEEIGQVLDAAGATWDDVVSMTTYHVHFRRDIDTMTEIHREFVTKEPFPAWTAVGVTALYEPEAIVEISVHAVVQQRQSGE
jgi:enamine deaminase RidA (YjgF/YER057c/UK114 family)